MFFKFVANLLNILYVIIFEHLKEKSMSCEKCGECANNCERLVEPEQSVQPAPQEVVQMRSEFYKMDHLEEV